MRILGSAQAGMNPEIRPQDDLFGHVNGRWLDTVEIPADRSSWGPGVELAETTELQVHAIIGEIAERVAAGSAEADGANADDRKIAALYASFMDEAAADRRGVEPVRSQLQAVAGIASIRQLAGFLGKFERTGGTGLFARYIYTDFGDSGRCLVHIMQGGLALPDES